jgi:hypothetical protein
MFAAYLVKYFSRRAGASPCNVVEALTYAFLSISTSSDVEQALISSRVLYDCCGLSVYSEDHRAFRLL